MICCLSLSRYILSGSLHHLSSLRLQWQSKEPFNTQYRCLTSSSLAVSSNCLLHPHDDRVLSVIDNSMVVYEDFINEDEERNLILELEPVLRKIRYEKSHWDSAIASYRETERLNWNPINQVIIDKIRSFLFLPEEAVVPLDHVHVLDLAKEGEIKSHVDAVRFCGRIIGGLSLMSDSVMRLTNERDKSLILDLFLKRRSLYVMKDVSRYDFAHSVLGEKESKFGETVVPRDRRISVIFRCQPREQDIQDDSDPEPKPKTVY